MKQLAVCIPTYNQPDMIQEMLIRCAQIYHEAGVDMYIYDSSPGDETEAILLQENKNHENIYYKHLPADIHSNIKVLEAYKEIAARKEYLYLWLCPDYIQLTRQGVKCVLEHCQEGFDICVLNYRDVEQLGEKIYTDVNAFFLDCAWHMSSYMATVIRLSVLADMDWEHFYERYTTSGRISHSHVALYFEQLAKLPAVKAVHIPISSVHMRVSPFRKESLWKKDVFPIWCEHWPDMIRALPARYQYKDEVIKKLGVNTGILAWNNFIGLRREGIYNRNIYCKYRQDWKKLTEVPGILLWLLAVMPSGMTVLWKRPSLKRSVMVRRLRGFSAKQQDIFIYGCGFMAKKASELLDELNIKYCGYIVSDCSSEKQRFHGLPVIEIEDASLRDRNVGIIVALNKKNTVQVIKEKPELSIYRTFYMYKYEDVLN